MKLPQPLRDLPGHLLRGALITGPLVATVYVMYFIFRTVDALLPIGIPGLGLLISAVLVAGVGYFSTHVIGSGIDRVDRARAAARPIRQAPATSSSFRATPCSPSPSPAAS